MPCLVSLCITAGVNNRHVHRALKVFDINGCILCWNRQPAGCCSLRIELIACLLAQSALLLRVCLVFWDSHTCASSKVHAKGRGHWFMQCHDCYAEVRGLKLRVICISSGVTHWHGQMSTKVCDHLGPQIQSQQQSSK